MDSEKRIFTYNKGVAKEPDVTLDKVVHIDLDSLLLGIESEVLFVTPTDEGFSYLKDIRDVVKAYSTGRLYVISGDY
ncbi:hypothetical protein M2K31_001729 [Salmonella enterica]|nr:hypothetical protein [Salmonella enterica subsp. enterica]EDU5496424.1 hypothetical protein [Salmonella enterica]EGI4905620.1 hypothetical protein [Salmonella enterica subsp. enterica serovar Lanka]EHA3471896.1 hypothetical protein [Salmonella enterica subsp. enterica serovar Weltevreden]EHQ9651076.1 hypothetical protein [Salmonella enterica]